MLAHLDALEEAHGIENLAGVAGRNLDLLAEVSADGDEGRVEAARRHLGVKVLDFVVEDDFDAQVLDPGDLGFEDVTWQAIGRDAEVHHPARHRAGLMDHHGMAAAGQVIGARKTGGTGSDDQHPLARRDRRLGEPPALLEGEIAQISLDGVDADRRLQLAAVAQGFARVVADPTMNGRQGVVLNEDFPGCSVITFDDLGEPSLDVLTGRARGVAGREEVEVDRTSAANRARGAMLSQVRR